MIRTARPISESELFGYEKGAFTGASRTRRGKFEAADGGTLFLDEIGEIPAGLQERVFHRVGGTVPVRVDVRIVAATNRDVAQAVKEGRFREDLYYRLSVVAIRVPPLRERIGDLPALCAHFLSRAGRPIEIDPETMEAMKRYSWPGNVRELQNVLERCSILAGGARIGPGFSRPRWPRSGRSRVRSRRAPGRSPPSPPRSTPASTRTSRRPSMR